MNAYEQVGWIYTCPNTEKKIPPVLSLRKIDKHEWNERKIFAETTSGMPLSVRDRDVRIAELEAALTVTLGNIRQITGSSPILVAAMDVWERDVMQVLGGDSMNPDIKQCGQCGVEMVRITDSGKPGYRSPKNWADMTFCSKTCSGAAISKERTGLVVGLLERNCKQCGKIIPRDQNKSINHHNNREFCSMECVYEFRADNAEPSRKKLAKQASDLGFDEIGQRLNAVLFAWGGIAL